jgi:hypothetical protein
VTFVAAAVAFALSTAGCAFSNINLVQDHRVALISPKAYSTVHLPVTVSWRTRNLPTSLDGQPLRFAVFVDRRVVAPGADVRSVASGDPNCRAAQGCPNAAYLRSHGVYVVTGTSLTLPFLPDLRDPSAGVRHDSHTVTVVILRGDRRDGESAFSTSFTIDRSRANT